MGLSRLRIGCCINGMGLWSEIMELQELNPDEQTWKHLKQYKLKAHQAQNKEELKKLIFAKMKSIQKTPTTIRSFFYEAGVT